MKNTSLWQLEQGTKASWIAFRSSGIAVSDGEASHCSGKLWVCFSWGLFFFVEVYCWVREFMTSQLRQMFANVPHLFFFLPAVLGFSELKWRSEARNVLKGIYICYKILFSHKSVSDIVPSFPIKNSHQQNLLGYLRGAGFSFDTCWVMGNGI